MSAADFIGYANIVLLSLAALVWGRYIYEMAQLILRKQHIPNVRSVKPVRRKIAQLITEMPRGRRGYRIVDLGSGSGLLTQHIAQVVKRSQVVGVERARFAIWLAKVRARLAGVENLEYVRADFFAYDVSDADVVVFYLGHNMMEALRAKLRAELKPGALVISNNFPLGGDWKPVEVLDVPSIYTHQTRVFVYRV